MLFARYVLLSERRNRRGSKRPGARGLVRTDDGFSVVEVMIAIAVFAVVATFMAQTLASGMAGILGGKRREVAIQEGNRLLEVARSLSFDAIGLIHTDTTIPTDGEIQTHNGKLSYRSASAWEPLVYATNPSGHPFNPHIQNVERGATDLTRYVYVTGIDSDNNGVFELKRVTIRVVWDNSGSPGPANEIRAQTLVNKNGIPTGTGGSTTPLLGRTSAGGGGLTLESSLLGLSAPLDISLPTSTGNSQYRAVSSTNCTTRSAALNVVDAVDLPAESVTVTADNDSRTGTPSEPPDQTKSGVLSVPAGPVANLVGAVINSPISCEADVASLGHEAGTADTAGTVTAQTNVLGLGGLLNWLFTIASLQTTPVTQHLEHEIVGGEREVSAQTTAGIGSVNLLKLPSAGITDGLVRIDAMSYGASVRGAAGTPSAAPSVTTPTFSIRVFDNGNDLGAGCATGYAASAGISVSRSGSYCVFSVNPAAAGFTGVTLPVVAHNFTQLLGLNVVSLSFTTNVAILPAAKSPAAGVTGPNGEKTWTAEYTPLSVSSSLDASVLGIPLIDADVDLALGSVKAEACAGGTCK